MRVLLIFVLSAGQSLKTFEDLEVWKLTHPRIQCDMKEIPRESIRGLRSGSTKSFSAFVGSVDEF